LCLSASHRADATPPSPPPFPTRRSSDLFADEAAATSAATALAASDAGGDARIEAIAPVDERDWVRLTQAQFGPTEVAPGFWIVPDRKSTRLNSSHVAISYAVFCLKKKNN